MKRKYRDDILSLTPIGQDYINLFYEHSDEVTMILLLNPDLTSHTAGVIGKLLPLVDALIEGKSIFVKKGTIEEIDGLLDRIDVEASPSLKSTVRKIRNDINRGEIFEQIGIKIGK